MQKVYAVYYDNQEMYPEEHENYMDKLFSTLDKAEAYVAEMNNKKDPEDFHDYSIWYVKELEIH